MLDLMSISYSVRGKDILKGISCQVQPAQQMLIYGASGCGKSTLMHIMAGFLKPTSGKISFMGSDYADLSDAALDRLRGEKFGFLFQKMHLIGHLTARQNIELAAKGDIDEALSEALGIAKLLSQKASSLSVGEAQRVALARAVANKPQIIFADEPTSALDSANAKKVIDILCAEAQKCGASLIVTSHDERIQSRFDKKLKVVAS